MFSQSHATVTKGKKSVYKFACLSPTAKIFPQSNIFLVLILFWETDSKKEDTKKPGGSDNCKIGGVLEAVCLKKSFPGDKEERMCIQLLCYIIAFLRG